MTFTTKSANNGPEQLQQTVLSGLAPSDQTTGLLDFRAADI
jgi:hypothetical protein